MRHARIAAALSVVLLGASAGRAWGHAALRTTDPLAGARLRETPTAIRLSFYEPVEASLSFVRVTDRRGVAHANGHPDVAPSDPDTLVIRVPRLAADVYTVRWRAVSKDDGHSTAGVFGFGVGARPPVGIAAERATTPGLSGLEAVARWLFIVGLVVLLGAATAALARFGTPASENVLATVGSALAAAGLALLVAAQRRNAGSSFDEVLHTAVGRAWVWRAVAIAAAGTAVALARLGPPRSRRLAMLGAAAAAIAAMAVHVGAGHAASGTSSHALGIAAQAAHFAAAGVWLGGLAALLLGLRSAAPDERWPAVRRFSTLAGAGLVVVAATGVLRAVQELGSWGDLVSTGYGRTVAIKAGLILLIAGLGALNRLRHMRAGGGLAGLRRTAGVELGLAAGAFGAAALLGTLAPPAAGTFSAPSGIAASGSDRAGTVRVDLSTATAEPGANRFVAHVLDARSRSPATGARVRLRFTPLDDPGVASSSLALRPSPDGAFTGSGSNLAFDGRWRVVALVARPAGSVSVPLQLEARGPPQFVSVLRVPGRAPQYTLEVADKGFVRITPVPERAGRSKIYVTCYDVLQDEGRIARAVVTAASKDRPTRQLPLRRLGPGRFVADVELAAGRNTIAVVARDPRGTRLRSSLDLDVPSS